MFKCKANNIYIFCGNKNAVIIFCLKKWQGISEYFCSLHYAMPVDVHQVLKIALNA